MKRQLNKYYFGRNRNFWGIWLYGNLTPELPAFVSGKHIKDVRTYEEAVREVYRLNGWGEPKSIKRTF